MVRFTIRTYASMTLKKLAHELEETARQTETMADGIIQALAVLGNAELDPRQARELATSMIVHAIQGQDRIEQRLHNMAQAVRQLAVLPVGTPDEVVEEIWSGLVLDELRVPGLSGAGSRTHHGDAELF